jgi:hypothetical protein
VVPDVPLPVADDDGDSPDDAASGTCPRCGGSLEGIDARSARDVRAEPCGCRVGHVRVRRVFGSEDGVVPELAVPPR